MTDKTTEEIENAICQLEAWRSDYAALRKEALRLRAVNKGLTQNFSKAHSENAELRAQIVEAKKIVENLFSDLATNSAQPYIADVVERLRAALTSPPKKPEPKECNSLKRCKDGWVIQ